MPLRTLLIFIIISVTHVRGSFAASPTRTDRTGYPFFAQPTTGPLPCGARLLRGASETAYLLRAHDLSDGFTLEHIHVAESEPTSDLLVRTFQKTVTERTEPFPVEARHRYE